MKLYKNDIIQATMDFATKRIYFYGGIFSQWHKSSFNNEQGVQFTSAEQAMMYEKAMLFGDHDIAKAILKANHPRIQKELGRKVTDYDDKIWAECRLSRVTLNNFYKFSQNPILKDIILSLIDWEFVEASPTDKIWGVGLAENDPKIYDRSNWAGLNLLGIAIKDAQMKILHML